MGLKEFIEDKEVDFTRNLVGVEEVKKIEQELGVAFGGEMTKYILKYGYLAYKHIELYGVNSNQLMDSDLIKQTKYLHTYFPKLISYIAIWNSGDGNYLMVSSEDEVYEYSTETDDIIDTDMKLFDYILKIFKEVDD